MSAPNPQWTCADMQVHDHHIWTDGLVAFECPGVLASKRGPNLVVAEGECQPCSTCDSTEPLCDHRTVLTGNSFMNLLDWLADDAPEEVPHLKKTIERITAHQKENE